MHRHFPLLTFLIVALVATHTAHAQLCLGTPFSAGPVRASVGYEDASRLDVFRGEHAYGTKTGDFGVLAFQHSSLRSAEEGRHSSSNELGGTVGHEFSVAGSGARLCPIAPLGYYSGSATLQVNNSSTVHGPTYDLGAAFGFNVAEGPTARVIPSRAVVYVGNHLPAPRSSTANHTTSSLPATRTATGHSHSASAGAGSRSRRSSPMRSPSVARRRIGA